MLKKFVLVACAFLALAANAAGVVDLRIYHASTTADDWPKTLEALTILKVVEGDQVKVEGLLDYPCHAVDWKDEALCSDAAVKAAHVAALKGRNPALRGEFISLKELQALGQSQEGINLPVSPAFKAKVDAPVVKTAAAAQPQASAPAPTVASTTVSAASASNQKLVTVDRDQVAKWATLTAENDKQLRAQAAQVASQKEAIDKLGRQLDATKRGLPDQLADVAAKAAAPAASQAAAALKATEEIGSRIAGILPSVEGQINGFKIATDDRIKTVEGGLKTAQTDIRQRSWWLVGLTLVVTLAIIGLVVNWRRTAATAQAVEAVKERVEDVAEKAGVHGPNLFDKRALKKDLSTLEVGNSYPLELEVGGEVKVVVFQRHEGNMVAVHGVRGQANLVKITNVTGCLYGAISRGDVIGVSTAPVQLRPAA